MAPVRHRLYRTGRKKSGRTQPATETGAKPRLPHEHDESSDSQTAEAPHPEIVQAHQDLEAGLVDTDRGAPADRAYQKQKDDPARQR